MCVENNWHIFLLAVATVGILPSTSSPRNQGETFYQNTGAAAVQRCHIKRLEQTHGGAQRTACDFIVATRNGLEMVEFVIHRRGRRCQIKTNR